jgi:predicted SprT family Zn-dependent metalloprotease
MELHKAQQLAVKLMEEHNLFETGWRFGFDSAIRRFGCCKYGKKEITLSQRLVLVNNEESVLDTILHEIAHAIVGPRHGHNAVWKAKAIEIGCNGKRCYSSKEVVIPETRYVAICRTCGHTHKRYKRPTRVSACGLCCKGKFNADYILEFKLNPNYL